MKFETQRETLLAPVQAVIGVVERRQTMPVLANLLLSTDGTSLSVTATDLEVELLAKTTLEGSDSGEVTVPGRKFLDILRALPEASKLSVKLERERLTIRSGRTRFTLTTLPAAEFPLVEDIQIQQRFALPQSQLRELMERTHFAMAQQDVRYYLNGLLLEIQDNHVRAVATDGHRLALCELADSHPDVGNQQVIIPRKGVMELQRLLGDGEEDAQVEMGTNHIRVQLPNLQFTSKLIDGRFPDYDRVLPKGSDKQVTADRVLLREALARAAILSNEKFRGIRLQLKPDALQLLAHNPEQEEAEDEIEVSYQGEPMEIGFNVTYLTDALGAIDSDTVVLNFSDANSSCLIQQPDTDRYRYVVMPMRL